MEKKGKKEISTNKNKMMQKIPKKFNLKKEKTVTTMLKESKRIIHESKENLKSKNKPKIISSKKHSMDNKEIIPNSNSNPNNITDSSEILIDKKKIKKEIPNKKVNLKANYNKNQEEKIEKNTNLNNKDYIINPFLINIKEINNNNIINNNSGEKDNNNNNKKEEEKNINKDNIKRQTYNKDYNKDNLNIMELSFDKKLENAKEEKDKENFYKNRFLTKFNKNKNNSNERKTEGSFGSLIHQKKLKLFSFVNEHININSNNFNNNNFNINMKESTIGSISSKEILHEQGYKENKLLTEIKDGLKKVSEKKTQVSAQKQNVTEKKIFHQKVSRFDKNLIKNDLDTNNNHKETKEILKLETKINKNREILFKSKGKTLKEKNKNNFKLLFNQIPNSSNNKTKNTQRAKTSKLQNEKRISYNPLFQSYNDKNKPLDSPKNKKKLINSNSNLSKNKLDEKTILKEVDKEKEQRVEKAINFKRNLSPAKINIDLEEKTNDNEYYEKPFVLSSEKNSSINNDTPIFPLLKDNNNNKKGEKLLSMETIFLSNRFTDLSKSPRISIKKDNNDKILTTKAEIEDINDKNKISNKLKNDTNIKNNVINFNLYSEKTNIKNNKKNKNSKNQRLASNEVILMPMSTLDNESFKKSTVKKLIKNNQYRVLLSEMDTVNLNKLNYKERDKEAIKEKDNLKIKKKFKFSERRKGQYRSDPSRKLTESTENYYNLYKKAFNDNKYIEQKFSFRPKSKNKNIYYKYNNKSKDKDNEDEKILNKKLSTISFNSKQKHLLDSGINSDAINYHKNVLNNSSDVNIYDKEDENENDNKNFILDLNHFIPIDENKLINTFSKPLFSNGK